MTITAFALRILRRMGFLRTMMANYIKRQLHDHRKLERLNTWYNKRNFDEQSIIQNTYSKIFRDTEENGIDDSWNIKFRDAEFKLPLRKDKMWLDWDNALSILGHDPEVKMTYEYLLNKQLVTIFFDVGGNYGTHSLLFLSQGIKVWTFEPNIELKKEFDLFCGLNNMEGKLENIAISDRSGSIDFFFPEKDTWLGTVVPDRMNYLKDSHNLKKIEVPCITLDDFCTRTSVFPDLVKIDTEGNELDVLKGASALLADKKPIIIFEAINSDARESLWSFFKEKKYELYNLPYLGKGDKKIDMNEFISCVQYNFIALPVPLSN